LYKFEGDFIDFGNLDKAQFKKLNKIAKLSPVDLIREVLKHYKCPESCGGACCKNLTVPFSVQEVESIARTTRGNYQILNSLVYLSGKYEMLKDQEDKEKFKGGFKGFKVFPSKPCLFQDESNLCKIYKKRPSACTTYPLNAIKGEVPGQIKIKISLCELGFNLYLDYVPFLYQTTINNPYTTLDSDTLKGIAQNIRESESYLINIINKDKTDFTKIGFLIIQNIDILRHFCNWLEILGPAIITEREKYRIRLIEQEQNLECLLPIDIIEVESKPEEYTKKVIIPSCKQFICRTKNNETVYSFIEAETLSGFIININVPANTSQIYIYPVIEK
jgi:hypothetical protein